MDLAQDKAQLRKTLYARRKAAHAAGAVAAGEAAADRFVDAGFASGARIVSGYRPIRTEIDPTPLMKRLSAQGLTLAVPVIVAPGQALEFRTWWPGCTMETGAFGAEIPVGGEIVEPDLVIAPLIGFDRRGWRLGYGGGFYDRTLAGLRARRPTLAVGFAFSAQEEPEIPREPTDQPLDAVVTERECIRP